MSFKSQSRVRSRGAHTECVALNLARIIFISSDKKYSKKGGHGSFDSLLSGSYLHPCMRKPGHCSPQRIHGCPWSGSSASVCETQLHTMSKLFHNVHPILQQVVLTWISKYIGHEIWSELMGQWQWQKLNILCVFFYTTNAFWGHVFENDTVIVFVS